MTTRGNGATTRQGGARRSGDGADRRLIAACGFCGTYDKHTAACEAGRAPHQSTIEYSSDLDICDDCLMLIANGGGDQVEPSWCPDNAGDRPYDYVCSGDCEAAAAAHAAAVELNWPDPWHLDIGARECEYCSGEDEEDCEPWFSWHACHTCGSRLGGNRHHAIAWRETT